MKKPTNEELKSNLFVVTGLITEYAFLKSLFQSKTLRVMVIVGLIVFGGFGLFLYKMAGT